MSVDSDELIEAGSVWPGLPRTIVPAPSAGSRAREISRPPGDKSLGDRQSRRAWQRHKPNRPTHGNIVIVPSSIPAAVKQQAAVRRMPAEWEPHEATWLTWPRNRRDWPGKFGAIGWVYVEMVRLLHGHERVCIVVEDAKREERARGQLDKVGVDLSRVEFFRFATDRSWLRDSGPTFVWEGEEAAAVCWRFNAWARYSNWKRDRRLGRKIANAVGARIREPKFGGKTVVLEGGAIDVNGLGTLLTTEECLLTGERARNEYMRREDYAELFAEQLGVRHVLWLGRGIAGDDTGGHVDDLARFVGPRTVVTVVESDTRDENYEPLRENLRRLRAMTDQDGRVLEVVELPMPRPLWFEGRRLPASYVNFYIANGIVLVPTFNDANDRVALSTIERLFPEREVRGLHAVDFVWGLGTIHCAAQQQPSLPCREGDGSAPAS